ncbi:hypothetical protein MBLNU459_g1655t1 [Dothideomycetes sp. NU459]
MVKSLFLHVAAGILPTALAGTLSGWNDQPKGSNPDSDQPWSWPWSQGSGSSYNGDATYQHVAVFSIDGMHASDIDKYLAIRPNSNISQLLGTGYLYPNANTSAPSDSYPGSIAQFTGGSPKTTGIWYDVIYNRAIYPIGSNCTGPQGTEVADDETIDYNSTELFSGGIDPANLPFYMVNGTCKLFYPHNRVRVNTVFEVVRSKGLQTAYTDKHPAYDIMRGPSGKGLSVGYFPEIAAVANNVNAIIAYDQLHVNAFLDWLDATTPANSEGNLTAVPSVFAGNFQSLNVAQKTVGYENTTGNPFSPAITQALDFVDASLGAIVNKLKAKNLYEKTLIIVASKHGQAPINPELRNTVDPAQITNATGVAVEYQASDDIALIFLNNTFDTQTAVDNLNKDRAAGKIFEIFSNAPNGSLSMLENGFGTVLDDPAVPDIIVQPDLGTIYTNNKKKFAEHGGFTNDDRNIACFVSNPRLQKQTFSQSVSTQQVAPLILKALGIEITELQAVVAEGVEVLPGF